MKQIDIDGDSDVAQLIKTRLRKTPEHRREIQKFSYRTPSFGPISQRAIVRLATTDILLGMVQVFKSGGETRMHSHTGMDGFWLVLGGRARFYFDDNTSVEVGRFEGVCTPREVNYWFEAIGPDPLEILQVDAIHSGLQNWVQFVAAEDRPSGPPQHDIYDAQTDG